MHGIFDVAIHAPHNQMLFVFEKKLCRRLSIDEVKFMWISQINDTTFDHEIVL
jgi:hypothetical protein